MNIYLSNLWNQLKTSFWLLPALMTAAAFPLSFITLNLDRTLEIQYLYSYSIWQGGAEGAREILSTIAGSIITITGVVFSITTVALALTSNLYSSKLLPNFMRDWGTQVVLGTFISTSIYTLLILRTIKGHGANDNNIFVPNFSITMSLGLAILSLSMLIYFIHHLSVRIQSTDIISRVAGELIQMIETSTQNQDVKMESITILKKSECKQAIISSEIGYLQVIDYKKLLDLAKKNQFIIEIDVRPGHFLRKGMVLAKVNSPLSEKIKKSISDAFIIGKERSPTQDIEYSIDQIVVIALKALSPNANDNFTAITCIDYLGAALCLICQKELKSFQYVANPYIRLVSKQETFEGLVDASFNQIRQFASTNPAILIRILEILSCILLNTRTQDQRIALKKHATMIKNLGSQLFEEQDKKDVQERFNQFKLRFEK